MYYANIKGVDVADGPGVRVSLFVSGCRHHCRECFNAMAWDFQYGKPYTEETQAELLRLLSPAYIQGLTLLGGEPFEPENQHVLVKLLRKVRETYPKKDIWCYTGYTYEKDLLSDSVSGTGVKVRTEVTDEILEKKDSTLLFRGSSNQRLIGLHGYQVPDERKRDHEIKHYEGVYIPTRTAP